MTNSSRKSRSTTREASPTKKYFILKTIDARSLKEAVNNESRASIIEAYQSKEQPQDLMPAIGFNTVISCFE